MSSWATTDRARGITKDPTTADLFYSRLITAAQKTAAGVHKDPKLTSSGELWVTRGQDRLLIDRKGNVAERYKKS